MTARDFLRKVSNSKEDFLQSFLDLLKKEKVPYCVIGGLAVNAYAEPVVSLDLDVIIAARKLDALIPGLRKRYKIQTFPNSVNVSAGKSDMRIQIQTDIRYQPFIERASIKTVLGYKISVATIEDVFQGKVWAVLDPTRRASKRQKDIADLLRLIEAKEGLIQLLPEELRGQLF